MIDVEMSPAHEEGREHYESDDDEEETKERRMEKFGNICNTSHKFVTVWWC